MRSIFSPGPALLLVGCLLLIQTRPVWSAAPATFVIAPGSKVITQEEKGIGPDNHQGSGIGIILLEEIDRDESSGVKSLLTYHLRAKIFSSEGASLGLVRIPLDRTWGKLRKWWGWTLMPDGSVQELKKDALREENPLQGSEGPGVRVLTGQLKVIPGCVVEYGYTADERHVPELRTVNLRRGVPLRELRHRWTPGRGYSGDFRLPQDEGLDVTAVREGKSVLITARNLSAIAREPWMPPKEVAGGAVRLYYHDAAANEANFWGSLALRMSRAATHFAQDEPIRRAIASMALPATSDRRTRLKLAYDWVMTHVRNVEVLPGLGMSGPTVLGDMSEGLQAQEILERGAGDCRYITFLYWGIARALGADVGFVPVTDRRQRLFDAGLLTLSQFSRYLLAVGSPGERGEELSLVDICSDLPFGEIPWWHTGFESMYLGQESVNKMVLHPKPGDENISETEVQIRFQDDWTEVAHWMQTRRHQQGLAERLYLRRSGPGTRKQLIGQLCGEGGSFQVSGAVQLDADNLRGPLRLECEAGLQGAAPDSTIATFGARFMGPWVPPTPKFPSPDRVNPVVLDFPRVDRVGVDVFAPPGFVSSTPPPPIKLETPYGQYSLRVTARPDGYRVERVFFLTPRAPVPVNQYGALRAFLSDVDQADQTLLVFRRTAPGASPPTGS